MFLQYLFPVQFVQMTNSRWLLSFQCPRGIYKNSLQLQDLTEFWYLFQILVFYQNVIVSASIHSFRSSDVRSESYGSSSFSSQSLSLSQTISAYYTPLPLSFLTALYKQTGMVFQRRGTLERVGFFWVLIGWSVRLWNWASPWWRSPIPSHFPCVRPIMQIIPLIWISCNCWIKMFTSKSMEIIIIIDLYLKACCD